MKLMLEMLTKICKKKTRNSDVDAHSEKGFTMIEMFVVMLIIAILSAIAAPSWVAMINRTRLNDAQDRVLQALRNAQNQAKLKKTETGIIVRVGPKDTTDPYNLRWIIYPAKTPPSSTSSWTEQFTVAGLELDTTNTTMTAGALDETRKITFNDKGMVTMAAGQTDPGQITLQIKDNSSMKVCVKVLTILGAMQTGKNNECVK